MPLRCKKIQILLRRCPSATALVLFVFSLVPLYSTPARADFYASPKIPETITETITEIPTPPSELQRISQWLQEQENRSLEIPLYDWSIPTGNFLGIDWSIIINLGKALWPIIENSRPVATLANDYANGLPLGVKSATELDGFSNLTARSYSVVGENSFGSNVYEIIYTVVHQFGGSYQGKGKYLSTVSVIPTKVRVNWGFKANFRVNQVSTVNVGSRDEPIASIAMELSYSMESLVTSLRRTTLFQFRGDSSEVQVIGMP